VLVGRGGGGPGDAGARQNRGRGEQKIAWMHDGHFRANAVIIDPAFVGGSSGIS
jgi:hypothetical protein